MAAEIERKIKAKIVGLPEETDAQKNGKKEKKGEKEEA